MAVENDGAGDGGASAAFWGMSLHQLYAMVTATDPDPLRVAANDWGYLQRSLAQRLPVIYIGVSQLAPVWKGPAGAACVKLLNETARKMERLHNDAQSNAVALNGAYQTLVSAQANMKRLFSEPAPTGIDPQAYQQWLSKKWNQAFTIAKTANSLISGAATAMNVPSLGFGIEDTPPVPPGGGAPGATGGVPGTRGNGGGRPGSPGWPAIGETSSSGPPGPGPGVGEPGVGGVGPVAPGMPGVGGVPGRGSAPSPAGAPGRSGSTQPRMGTSLFPGRGGSGGRPGGSTASPGKVLGGGTRPGSVPPGGGAPGGPERAAVPGAPGAGGAPPPGVNTGPGGPQHPSTPSRPGTGSPFHPGMGGAPGGGAPGTGAGRRARRSGAREPFPVKDQPGVTPVYQGRLAEPPAPVDPGPMIGSQKRPAPRPDGDWDGDAPTVRQPESGRDVDWSNVRYPDAGEHQVSFRQRRRGQ